MVVAPNEQPRTPFRRYRHYQPQKGSATGAGKIPREFIGPDGCPVIARQNVTKSTCQSETVQVLRDKKANGPTADTRNFVSVRHADGLPAWCLQIADPCHTESHRKGEFASNGIAHCHAKNAQSV